VAARRKAEQLIVAGRVKVNGQVVRELGTTVDPDSDRVQVDGEAVHPSELFYCVLNKPKGSITAVSDPQGRRTVMEYLPNVPVQVAPVGRLDFYSEGVLLLTNDGELSAALQSPRTHAEKTYHVKIRGRVKEPHLMAMRRGVRLDDGTVTREAQVDRLRSESRHEWLVVTLTEGKSRQIHRMAEVLGYQVLKIQRVSFAGIDFHGLRVGDARELTQAEVSELREIAGLPKDSRAVARGKWRARREDTELSRRAKDRERPERVVLDELGEPIRKPEPAKAPPRDRAPGPPRDRAPGRAPGRGPSRDPSRGPVRGGDRDRGPSRDRDRDRGPSRDRDRARAVSRGPVRGGDRDRGPSRGPAQGRDRDRSRGPGAGPGRKSAGRGGPGAGNRTRGGAKPPSRNRGGPRSR
jgi:23S rRNA pseudouridine2605 synthase